jgi:pyridoxine 5-phosphate synthase
LTTEGGLDVAGNCQRLREVVARLQGAGIPVSMFIDADPRQIEASATIKAQFVELHTGVYAESSAEANREKELAVLAKGCRLAIASGLRVNAGHGLTYSNVYPVASLEGMEELNIGHTIISRAVLVGLERAVREMKEAMQIVNG